MDLTSFKKTFFFKLKNKMYSGIPAQVLILSLIPVTVENFEKNPVATIFLRAFEAKISTITYLALVTPAPLDTCEDHVHHSPATETPVMLLKWH